MKCLYCIVKEKNYPKIDKTLANYYMIPIEKPYRNIFFHKECLSKIDNILIFLTENVEIWYN
jgi:hypothetical protein